MKNKTKIQKTQNKETFIIQELLINLLKFTKKEGDMAKLTAWVVTILGVLLVLPLIGVDLGTSTTNWLIAIGVLVIGIGKLVRNYSKKRK